MIEARIWLKDISRDFKAMNAVWNAWVDPENKGDADRFGLIARFGGRCAPILLFPFVAPLLFLGHLFPHTAPCVAAL